MDVRRAILAALPPGAVRAGDAVVDVARLADQVRVRTASGSDERFDAVVLAVHADDARQILHDADAAERRALDSFSYSANQVVLHTDTRLMPKRRRAWASWNVEQDDCASPADRVAMTYHEPAAEPSRPGRLPRVGQPGRSCAVRAHPRGAGDAPSDVHLPDACRAGGDRAAAGPSTDIHAGAHLYYGFHEDGCRSGFEAAAMVDAALPVEVAA